MCTMNGGVLNESLSDRVQDQTANSEGLVQLHHHITDICGIIPDLYTLLFNKMEERWRVLTIFGALSKRIEFASMFSSMTKVTA
jgi:hypothetical protein